MSITGDPDDDALLPPGWTSDVAAADREWCEQYRSLDSPADVSNPVDCLPGGYAAYTLVLHSLDPNGSPRPGHLPWLTDSTADPWQQVIALINDHRVLTDVGRSLSDDDALLQELHLARTGPYSVGWFFPWPFARATGQSWAPEQCLRGEVMDPPAPTIWFPSSRQWFVSNPYDSGFTYIASDTSLAQRLQGNPDLETLTCTYSA